MFGHFVNDLAFLVVLFSKIKRELSSLLQIFHGRVSLHVSLEITTHLKENNACRININLVMLHFEQVMSAFTFEVIVVFRNKFFLFRAKIHWSSSKRSLRNLLTFFSLRDRNLFVYRRARFMINLA